MRWQKKMYLTLGCSAMGAEELEESEMEPFVAELEGKVSGKKICYSDPMVGETENG